MPWTPLIVIPLLFGVICGNRLMDSRMRRSFAGAKGTPTGRSLSSEPANSQYFGNNLYCLDNRLYGQGECGPSDNRLDNGNVDFDRFSGNTNNNKRDFHNANLRDLGDNTDTLSDIFADDGPNPSRLSENAGAYARHDLEYVTQQRPLPAAYYTDFDDDITTDTNKEDVKRAGNNPVIGCDCKIKNDLIDLGQQHFPRYLLNAVCRTEKSPNEYPQKCWRGSYCKPLEYKVRVLTFRKDQRQGVEKDPTLTWLPDDLRKLWKFKAITVAAGCFCSY